MMGQRIIMRVMWCALIGAVLMAGMVVAACRSDERGECQPATMAGAPAHHAAINDQTERVGWVFGRLIGVQPSAQTAFGSTMGVPGPASTGPGGR